VNLTCTQLLPPPLRTEREIPRPFITPLTTEETADPPTDSIHDILSPRVQQLPSLHAVERVSPTFSEFSQTLDSISQWVTVFGFALETRHSVERSMKLIGDCTFYQAGSGSNWVHVRFTNPIHAREALSKNGTIIDNIMIGVVPCQNHDLMRNNGIERASEFSETKIPKHENTRILVKKHEGANSWETSIEHDPLGGWSFNYFYRKFIDVVIGL